MGGAAARRSGGAEEKRSRRPKVARVTGPGRLAGTRSPGGTTGHPATAGTGSAARARPPVSPGSPPPHPRHRRPSVVQPPASPGSPSPRAPRHDGPPGHAARSPPPRRPPAHRAGITTGATTTRRHRAPSPVTPAMPPHRATAPSLRVTATATVVTVTRWSAALREGWRCHRNHERRRVTGLEGARVSPVGGRKGVALSGVRLRGQRRDGRAGRAHRPEKALLVVASGLELCRVWAFGAVTPVGDVSPGSGGSRSVLSPRAGGVGGCRGSGRRAPST